MKREWLKGLRYSELLRIKKVWMFLLAALVLILSTALSDAAPEISSTKISLVPGWNFISSPYADFPITFDASACGTDAASSASAFPAIYHYNPSTGEYDTLTSISEMKPGLGYWIFFDSEVSGIKDCKILFSGTKKVTASNLGDNSDGTLAAGWNHIGGTTDSTQLTSNENKGSCEIGVIYGYDAKTGEYTATDTMSAGNAYWVYVKKDCRISHPRQNQGDEAQQNLPGDTTPETSNGQDTSQNSLAQTTNSNLLLGTTLLIIDSRPQGAFVIISNETGDAWTSEKNITPFHMIVPNANYTAEFAKQGFLSETIAFEANSSFDNQAALILNATLSVPMPLLPITTSLKFQNFDATSFKDVKVKIDGQEAVIGSDGSLTSDWEPFEAKQISFENQKTKVSSSVLVYPIDVSDSSASTSANNQLTGNAIADSSATCIIPATPKIEVDNIMLAYDSVTGLSVYVDATNFEGQVAPVELFLANTAEDSDNADTSDNAADSAKSTDSTTSNSQKQTSTGGSEDKSRTVIELPKYTSTKSKRISAELLSENIGDIMTINFQGHYFPENGEEIPDHSNDIYSRIDAANSESTSCSIAAAFWPDVQLNLAKPEVSLKSVEKRNVVDILTDLKGNAYAIVSLDKDAPTSAGSRLTKSLAIISVDSKMTETEISANTKYHDISLGAIGINVVPTRTIYQLNRADPSGPLLPKTCTNTCPKKVALTSSFSCSTDCIDYTIESSREIQRNYLSALMDSTDTLHLFYRDNVFYKIKIRSYNPENSYSSSTDTTQTFSDYQYAIYDTTKKSFLAKHEVASLCAPYSSSNTGFFIDPKDNIFITETCPYDCENGKCPAMSYSQYTKTRVLNKNSFSWEKVPALGTDALGTPVFDSKGNFYQFSGFGYTKYVVGAQPSQSFAKPIKVELNQNLGKRISDPNKYTYGLPGDIGTVPLGANFDEEDNLCAIYSTGTNPDKTHSFYYSKISLKDDIPVLISKHEIFRSVNSIQLSMRTCNDLIFTDYTESKTYILKSLKTLAYEKPEVGWFKMEVGDNKVQGPKIPVAMKDIKNYAFSSNSILKNNYELSAIKFPKVEDADSDILADSGNDLTGNAVANPTNKAGKVYVAILVGPLLQLKKDSIVDRDITYNQAKKAAFQFKQRCLSCEVGFFSYPEIKKLFSKKNPAAVDDGNTFQAFNSYIWESVPKIEKNDVLFVHIVAHGNPENILVDQSFDKGEIRGKYIPEFNGFFSY